MIYLIEHKDLKGKPKSAAIISAFFAPHAMDIYEFIVDIEENDICNIEEIGEGFIEKTIYIEVNRFNEYLRYSLEKISPKIGTEIKEFVVSDTITNIYQITNNTTL